MTQEIHKSVERKIHHGALIMGAVSVGGLVEVGRAASERRQPVVAGVKSYFEDEGPSYIFFRGCGENHPAQAPLFHDKLGGYGSMHFEYQMQGQHSQDAIDQSIIKACKSDGDRDRVFVCSSMGLMNAMRSLTNPRVREAIGENRLQAVVSRSGITSKVDLQPKMQRAAEIAVQVPGLPIVGSLWRAHRLHQAHREIAHSSRTSQEEVLIHYESSAHMPFSLIASQYREINQSQAWAEGSHIQVAHENPDLRLFQITAEYDDVANWRSTNKSLEQAFGMSVETITDERRPHASHSDDLEFIEPLEELMMKLSGRSRSVAAAARNLVMYSDGSGSALAS